MNEIINGKAMIAPGIAGSATTTITGSLINSFDLPGASTALAVSFVFGLIVFGDKTVTILYKIVYYIIGSLTIFSVAVGLNQSGMAIVERDKPVTTLERTLPPATEKSSKATSSETKPFFKDWFK